MPPFNSIGGNAPPQNMEKIVIAIDAMGGDNGPAVVIDGMAKSAAKNPNIAFVLHGPQAELEPLVAKKKTLNGLVSYADASGVVTMDDKPTKVIRRKDTSMYSAVDSVRTGTAHSAVSCGNTGALMALSTLRLRKLPGVDRTAISILWPSLSPQGFNVMLDVGADVQADAKNLLQYALMGASYARYGHALKRPRVGLLNIGTEEHKGRPELQEAHGLITEFADKAGFEFVGFVEGKDIPQNKADVIVTDGFTGNVAIKTGEGTASVIASELKKTFQHSILSRLSALLAYTPLRRFKKRFDPRRANGGIFLGLNGTVVKSHGGADATGVSAAIKLAFTLAASDFSENVASQIAASAELTVNAEE